MLPEIALPLPPNRNEFLELFNGKIREYNKLNNIKNINSGVSLQLLSEINYMHAHIKRIAMDNVSHEAIEPNIFSTIIDFPGIQGELKDITGIPTLSEISSDALLINLLDSNQNLSTADDFNYEIGLKSWIPYYHPSEYLQNIAEGYKALINEKITLSTGGSSPENYFYELNKFRDSLLHNLCYTLDDNEKTQVIGLLHKINHEIKIVQMINPAIQERHKVINEVSDHQLFQELSSLSPQKQEELVMMLKTHTAINPGPPNKIDIATILPGIMEWGITKLGGGNNVNYKISLPGQADFVIQITPPMPNQGLIFNLEKTEASNSLTINFHSTFPTNDVPYSLVLTEFCSGGDLKAYHRKIHSLNNDDKTLDAAVKTIKDVTAICEFFLKNKVIHPDIKLANFLLDENKNIKVADKKTFERIDENGNIAPNIGLQTTTPFAPPEFRLGNSHTINAEAFMTYQLGIAFYDAILLPTSPEDKNEPLWSEKNPLDFSNPIFDSDKGRQIQTLIEAMTDQDPCKRISLNQAHHQLNLINFLQQNPDLAAARMAIALPPLSTMERGKYIVPDLNTSEKMKKIIANVLREANEKEQTETVKSQIENITTLEELQSLKHELKESASFASGIACSPSFLGTLDKIFEEREKYIQLLNNGKIFDV